MRAGSSNWLLLSTVVLSALVFAESHFQAGTGSGYQTVESSSTPIEAMPVPRFALVDRERLSETLARPLFMPNRRPPEAKSAASAAPEAPAASQNVNRYALSAIIIVDNERIALLTDTATGNLNRVREGESVAGWQVEAIRADSAVLRHGDIREELALRHFGPPLVRPKTANRRTANEPTAAAQPPDESAKALLNRPRRAGRDARRALRIPQTESN
ncbi:MAG: hypothetical protein E4H01_02120 [Lysobacterales bacterium]|nr:MAG: hypothetical protein E4H01_02120 [Xanthomonadales bacterium]